MQNVYQDVMPKAAKDEQLQRTIETHFETRFPETLGRQLSRFTTQEQSEPVIRRPCSIEAPPQAEALLGSNQERGRVAGAAGS